MPALRVTRSAHPAAVRLVVALTLGACARAPGREARTTPPADGWQPLIAASSLAGWRGYQTTEVPAGWTVTDGVLGRRVSTGDLVTQEAFGDFELQWEWKVAVGGDAGVFYRGTEQFDRIFWSGVEYQLQDDAHAPDGPSRLTAAGSVYGLYPARAGVVRPAGQWNASRVIARGPHVEHWLNGEKLAEYTVGSPDWAARVAASKFARWPNYGGAARGHVVIQGDHDGDLAIRAMRIRALR